VGRLPTAVAAPSIKFLKGLARGTDSVWLALVFSLFCVSRTLRIDCILCGAGGGRRSRGAASCQERGAATPRSQYDGGLSGRADQGSASCRVSARQ